MCIKTQKKIELLIVYCVKKCLALFLSNSVETLQFLVSPRCEVKDLRHSLVLKVSFTGEEHRDSVLKRVIIHTCIFGL